MAWWMAAPLALNAVGSIGSIFGASGAARQARRETDEEVRRLGLQQRATLAEGAAAGAASGIESDSGSLRNYLDTMDAEFTREREWMKRAGYARARGSQLSSIFGAVSGGASSLFQFGASNNWWQKPGGGGTKPTYTPGSGQPPWRP